MPNKDVNQPQPDSIKGLRVSWSTAQPPIKEIVLWLINEVEATNGVSELTLASELVERYTETLEALIQKAVSEAYRRGYKSGFAKGAAYPRIKTKTLTTRNVCPVCGELQVEVNDLQPSDSNSDTESANAPKPKNQDKS